jgi:hypothetical protein
MMAALGSSETSVHTKTTRRNIPEDTKFILQELAPSLPDNDTLKPFCWEGKHYQTTSGWKELLQSATVKVTGTGSGLFETSEVMSIAVSPCC